MDIRAFFGNGHFSATAVKPVDKTWPASLPKALNVFKTMVKDAVGEYLEKNLLSEEQWENDVERMQEDLTNDYLNWFDDYDDEDLIRFCKNKKIFQDILAWIKERAEFGDEMSNGEWFNVAIGDIIYEYIEHNYPADGPTAFESLTKIVAEQFAFQEKKPKVKADKYRLIEASYETYRIIKIPEHWDTDKILVRFDSVFYEGRCVDVDMTDVVNGDGKAEIEDCDDDIEQWFDCE